MNSCIDDVHLLNNSIGVEGARLLARKFKEERIDLSGTSIHDKGAQEIAELIKLKNIKAVDISACGISDFGICAIADAIIYTNSLKSIYLDCNDFGNEGMKCLIEALKKNHSLQVFVVTGYEIDQSFLRVAEDIIARNRSKFVQDAIEDFALNLQSEIFLNHYSICYSDLRKLSKELCSNYYLTKLCLSNMNIRSAGVSLISEALFSNSHLKVLEVSQNAIEKDGVVALAEALKVNSCLHLSLNSICLDGATALSKSLLLNSCLESLIVDGCNLREKEFGVLASALIENNSLQTLSIRYNSIGEIGAWILSELIVNNRTLQSIFIERNSIPSYRMNEILEALVFNNSILNFTYRGNDFDQISSEIEFILEKNKKVFRNECKMLIFELFARISAKVSCMLEMNIASSIMRDAGLTEH
jgi:Ran GTPase-activating protein (RanGAP) involved in mRNA processing and transport